VLNKSLTEAAQICAQIPSFGERLDQIRIKRQWTQKQLAKCLFRSEAEVSRLLKNQIPKNLLVTEVRQWMEHIDCTRTECAELMEAFACYVLSDRELIDVDIF
jgi:transcriptional regulator with XRE-family HTH domain